MVNKNMGKKEDSTYISDPGLNPLGSAKSCTTKSTTLIKDGWHKIWFKLLARRYLIIVPKVLDPYNVPVDDSNAGV